MKSVVLITATQSKTLLDFKNTPIYKSIDIFEKIYKPQEFRYEVKLNNSTGLPEIYNSFIKNDLYKNCILVFVHDDVIIEDLFFVEKIQNSPYDVTGLAGCSTADLSKPPAWHLMSPRDSHMGQVTHAVKDSQWTNIYGPVKGRSLIVDGLFISIDVDKINSKNVKFNEGFDFHHYDISFCLDCNKSKLTIGVIPLNVIHYGLGDSMNTPEWHKSAKVFKKLYS